MPPRSTTLRGQHLDEYIYDFGPTTVLYKFLDALCGSSGAGRLIQEIFMSRANAALSTIAYRELDYIFGHMNFLARSSDESYPYDPGTQLLTTDQWDEVRVKDAWYRARIKAFFDAISTGPTPVGVRKCVFAALGVDADLYEVWRMADSFGIGSGVIVGRAPVTARNEIVIKPHKDSLSPQEFRQARDMLKRMMPVDTIVTINLNGLAVTTPVEIHSAAASSTYYEVQKYVTPTPVIDSLPAPELLAIDLDPSEQWLLKGSKELAPYAALNITSEYGDYYLVSGGARSPIDSVSYGTLQADGSVKTEDAFTIYQDTGQYTDWISYDRADSPDNYPGGKFGLHPEVAPALNQDQSAYQFPWPDQATFVAAERKRILGLGGIANDDVRYKLPIEKAATTKLVFSPDLAWAYDQPTKQSTVTSSWTQRRNSQGVGGADQIQIFQRNTT
jgi:hypothetical protein